MAYLCRILTSVMLAAHLTVGCCAHHAHACDGKQPSPGAPQQPASHHSCTPVSGLHGQVSGPSHGHSQCQGTKCSMVMATGSTVLLLPLYQAPGAILSDHGSPLLGIHSQQHDFSAGRLLLPVSLHLANQVLLI
jgi:hypothetical protein